MQLLDVYFHSLLSVPTTLKLTKVQILGAKCRNPFAFCVLRRFCLSLLLLRKRPQKCNRVVSTRRRFSKLNCRESNYYIILKLHLEGALAALALSDALNAKWFDKATSWSKQPWSQVHVSMCCASKGVRVIVQRSDKGAADDIIAQRGERLTNAMIQLLSSRSMLNICSLLKLWAVAF